MIHNLSRACHLPVPSTAHSIRVAGEMRESWCSKETLAPGVEASRPGPAPCDRPIGPGPVAAPASESRRE
jgi:hypothetical protein